MPDKDSPDPMRQGSEHSHSQYHKSDTHDEFCAPSKELGEEEFEDFQRKEISGQGG